jgi:glycosyltransferase involved in cell wall biosynthesis
MLGKLNLILKELLFGATHATLKIEMKICLDISQVVYGTGVSTYTSNLVENLLLIDKENEYVLFGGSARRKADLEKFTGSLKGNFSKKLLYFPPTLADLLWNRVHFLKIDRLVGKIDVFHSSDWTQPPTGAFKVTTIHDLSPIRYPKLTHPKIVSTFNSMLKWVKKETDRIIVPSEATREDLVLLKFSRGKIRVIPEAVDPYFKKTVKKKENTSLKEKIKAKKYILSVGVSPRKNTKRVIESFKLANLPQDYELLLVGENNFNFEGGKKIKFLGHVSKKELKLLYNHAELLLYPSLYEGFGLPILEAFAAKVPVVTSNLSSMPEVAGNAAIMVDPFESGSIMEGIKLALKNKESLVKKGLAQLNIFSWAKTAELTLDVYNESKLK